MKDCIISVAICTFNGSLYLNQQLYSILQQSRLPDEIIVCDDCSTDQTVQILEDFALKHKGLFKVFKNEKSLGARRNFEKAIRLCSGDLIFLCDQDDIWLSTKIERQMQYMLSNNALGVFCNGLLIDQFGNDMGESMWDALYFESELREKINSENLLYYLLLNGNVVTGTALCFRSEVVPFILPINTDEGIWHDHWIALILSTCRRLLHMEELLLKYRIHNEQQVGFTGRGISNPSFRAIVHRSWLTPMKNDFDGQLTMHFAWAILEWERRKPQLSAICASDVHTIDLVGALIRSNFFAARKTWLSTFPWPDRKLKLLKHWLKGGEYLRIKLIDVITI